MYTQGLLQGLVEIGATKDVILHTTGGLRVDPDLQNGDRQDLAKESMSPIGSVDIAKFTQVSWSKSPLLASLVRLAWTHRVPYPVGRKLETAQVMHCPSFVYPLAPANTRQVVVVHDLAWKRYPGAFSKHGVAWHDRALSRAIERSDVIVVPSAQSADDLDHEISRKETGERPAIEIVEWGSNHVRPRSNYLDIDLDSRFGINGPYLVTVGTREPRKNLDNVLAAFEMARTQLGGNLQLVVIGPPGWGPITRPTSASVIFTGHLPDHLRDSLVAQASGCLYVPLYEGWGFPVVEAMACQIPVISSKVPSAATATRLVDPESPEDIALAIVEVVSDPQLAARLVEKGAVRVAELTWARCAKEHLRIWTGLV